MISHPDKSLAERRAGVHGRLAHALDVLHLLAQQVDVLAAFENDPEQSEQWAKTRRAIVSAHNRLLDAPHLNGGQDG